MANYVAIDGPPDQVWLPWMVRFAESGPPLASRLKVDKTVAAWNSYRQNEVTAFKRHACTFVAMVNE